MRLWHLSNSNTRKNDQNNIFQYYTKSLHPSVDVPGYAGHYATKLSAARPFRLTRWYSKEIIQYLPRSLPTIQNFLAPILPSDVNPIIIRQFPARPLFPVSHLVHLCLAHKPQEEVPQPKTPGSLWKCNLWKAG